MMAKSYEKKAAAWEFQYAYAHHMQPAFSCCQSLLFVGSIDSSFRDSLLHHIRSFNNDLVVMDKQIEAFIWV